jgi:hypothetical protein
MIRVDTLVFGGLILELKQFMKEVAPLIYVKINVDMSIVVINTQEDKIPS